MKHEWKPGDVAMLRTEGGERIGFRSGVPKNLGWEYEREPGQKTWSADSSGYVTPIRPLVVIDPEDRESVERLVEIVNYGGDATSFATRLQAALREFANPTPPKPDEPLGLGAVVEDADGLMWCRDRDGFWQSENGSHQWRSLSGYGVRVVRVLSEGVTS